MKSKKMFLSLVAIIFSIFIGYNIYSVENSQQTFDVSFLNIEALASGESSGNCPEYGIWLFRWCMVAFKAGKMVTYYFS